ncbi:MAG: aminotransferase class V-fold PLP-dependent enzyme [Rhodospirillales bacterium]
MRRETPGTEHVLHFNNAGAALMPQPVLDAVNSHFRREALTGGYEAAGEAAARHAAVYQSIATLIGAQTSEIALVENATVAWQLAFYAFDFRPGDRIITAQAEYAANYVAYLQVARKYGVEIDVVPNDESGALSVEALAGMIGKRTKLISITHVPTNGGLVNPAAEIGKLAKAAGIPYLLDACQAVGQLPVDVDRIGCDILTATSRKYLRGPRGAGFLYVRDSLLQQLEPPMLDHHAAPWVAAGEYRVRPDARRFENWENNIAGQLGMGAAVDYTLALGQDAIWERIQHLATRLRQRLGDVPGVTIRDLGPNPCGIVTFTLDGTDLPQLKTDLRAEQINITISVAASTRLDMEARGLAKLGRASVHYYNTEDEIERFCAAVERLK